MSLTLVPLPCTILAIGPGPKRGWSVHRGEEILDFGRARSPEERQAAARIAIKAATKKRPLVAVMECWNPIWHRAPALFGMTIGRWLEILELAGHPKDRNVGVNPSDWRKAAIGHLSEDDEAICAKVTQDFGIATNLPIAGSILIGKWGIYANEVREVLPPHKAKITDPVRIWRPKVYESKG